MTHFSRQRFLQVARWDLTFNRAFYQKAALLIFVVMALPLISSMFTTIMTLIFTHGLAERPTYVPCVGQFSFFLGLMPFVCGFTFHNLLTKQSRVAELMLPATNLEKFLWHALLTIVGSLLVAVASMLVLDVVQMIYVAILSGPSHVVSGLPRLFADIHHELGYMRNAFQPHVVLFFTLSYLASCSFFVLGNAFKYKHNVILTLLVSGLVSLLGMILTASILFAVRPGVFECLTDLTAWQIMTPIYVLMLAFIAFCWLMAYRLYTRAQITCRRNK